MKPSVKVFICLCDELKNMMREMKTNFERAIHTDITAVHLQQG